MGIEVKHETRTSRVSLVNLGRGNVHRGGASAARGTGGTGGGFDASAVGVLAIMYQRIPANVLSKMEHKEIQNYALLESDGGPQNSSRTPGAAGSSVRAPMFGNYAAHAMKCNPCTKWRSVGVLAGSTLKQVLATLERVNSDNSRLEKIKLNFKDGYSVLFGRFNVSDPKTLRFVSEYDPGAVFRQTTASKASEVRAVYQKKNKFLVDDKGRALRPRSAGVNRPQSAPVVEDSHHESPGLEHAVTPGRVRPRSAFSERNPNPGKVGFAFKPVSMLSFAMKPNSAIPGCRPGIRNTNPQAIHYRPRALTRPLSPGSALHAQGLTLTNSSGIDYRNSVSPARSRSAAR